MEAILEGLQLVIPIYADWHINYEHSWENENENFGRVLGTVGNPLVLGVVFMLAIPFAMSIKNVYLKIIMILLIIAGAFLTVSKTVIVLAAINLFYYFVIIGRKHVAKSAILFALVLAILIMMTYSNKLMENPYVKLWTIRLTMETDNDLIDSRSISMRKDSAVNSFNKIVNGDVDKMLIGYGHATHVMISEAIEANFRTLDNVYLQVWHNNGIIGLIIFLIAFLYPAMNKRSLKYQTTYWFNALNFMLVGFSLVCYPYSAINILMVTSYALMNKKSDSNHVIYSCTVN